MIVELRTNHLKQALAVKRLMSSRLRAGLGVGGARLAPKRVPDGQPLGGRLPQLLLEAPVVATHAGYAIDLRDPVESFHRGGDGRPERPIVGLTASERRAQVLGDARLAARQITARLARGR